MKIPNSTNIDIFLHSKGLSIPLPSFLYDHAHIVNETNPSDPTVSSAIVAKLNDDRRTRNEYKTCITSQNRSLNSKNLKNATDASLKQHAETLPLQGEWVKLLELQNSECSFKALTLGLSEAIYRWLLKASTNTLPTMAYLNKIGRTISSSCTRCGRSPETLHHILNNCQVALDSGLYTWRHNEVLSCLFEFVQHKVRETPEWKVRADLQ